MLVLIVSLLIQLFTVFMIIYTFRVIKDNSGSELGVLSKYYLMRRRYDRLRSSLLFIAAIILLQIAGIVYLILYPDAPITTTQLIVSDIIFVALAVFLSQIYRMRSKLKFDDNAK